MKVNDKDQNDPTFVVDCSEQKCRIQQENEDQPEVLCLQSQLPRVGWSAMLIPHHTLLSHEHGRASVTNLCTFKVEAEVSFNFQFT